MSAPAALAARYEGEGVFAALPRQHASCDEVYVVGQVYALEAIDQAQSARDRAYHAELRECWANLPEDLAERFPNPTDFRRYCLAQCGFADVSRMAMKSTKDALSALAVMAKMGVMAHLDGAVLVVVRPMSQALRGPDRMTKEERLRSYTMTLEYAASLIGATAEEAARNSREAA